MQKPKISVLIPVKELNNLLFNENFPAMDKQTYRNFEVIVLPNKKSPQDSTLNKKYRWLRIIPTGKITRPAEKRDIGEKHAKGSILAFIDDDAYPANNWLEKAIYYFQIKKTESICGPGIIPSKTNIWEKIFNEILLNPIGSGGYKYRFAQDKARFVDDYPSMNFFIQKKVFNKLGGFNSEYWPGEDSKLCEDLIYKYKGKIFYTPDVITFHHRRNNLIGFLKQHANYGFHRGAFFAHGDRNSKRFSYLIPTIFVAYLFIILIYLFFFIHYYLFNIIYFPLIIYILLLIVLFINTIIRTQNIIIVITTIPVLFLTHITYGIMFIRGFFTGLFKKSNIYDKKS